MEIIDLSGTGAVGVWDLFSFEFCVLI